jgi:hypothetical protein
MELRREKMKEEVAVHGHLRDGSSNFPVGDKSLGSENIGIGLQIRKDRWV